MKRLNAALAARFAAGALDAVRREYPNHLAHWLNAADDARPPRRLHPVFYGCLDWHSAVHNHWLLARLTTLFPQAEFAVSARALLERRLTPERIAGECAYFAAAGREGFERPYGWAWLLTLDEELAAFPLQRGALAPLTELVASRVAPWLAALPYPVRTGEHANTAFALGLILDWARVTKRDDVAQACAQAAQRFYAADRNAPLDWEPSGHDFLSPSLAEADLMTRLYPPPEFARWLSGFLPDIPADGEYWLNPVLMPDSKDYKLAHLPGLNLSRAWMLSAIAGHLPAQDGRRKALGAAADEHATVGLRAALREDYGASHWLPTFAVYLLSGRVGPSTLRPHRQ